MRSLYNRVVPVGERRLLTPAELTPQERELCVKATEGRLLDLRSHRPGEVDPALGQKWVSERQIRAQVLVQLLTGHGPQLATSVGAVRLRGAAIGGRLNLGGMTLRCPLELYDCYLGGRLDLAKAVAPNISLRGSYLPRRLSARRLSVTHSLNLSGHFRCNGRVDLRSAHIGGQLDCIGATLSKLDGEALTADGLAVDGGLFLRGAAVTGRVRLPGAHIGVQLDFDGATLTTKDGVALFADGLAVDGNLFLRGAAVTGQVQLPVAHVTSTLQWKPKEVIDRLNLAFARTTVWVDDSTGRATPTVLAGFQYDALHPGPDEVSPKKRIDWLESDPAGYSPQPYAQLAAIYRAEGHDRHARTVLIASQNQRRRRGPGWRGWPGWAWGRLLWATVGYGYRPWLALLWLLALVTIGTLVVMSRLDADLTAGPGAPARNALLYTVDVLLPFVDLGYGKWVAHGTVVAVTAVLVLLGWVLATALVAAFAGVLRRGD